MEKLFYEKTYIKTFEANVTECRPGENGRFEVFLNRTAFYPEGGGQPSDIGTLGEAVVLSVKETKEGIIHQTDRPLLKGNVVKGVLDWKRRFSHMQNHTGEHLLSGVVHKKFGYDNVGFHMGKNEVTVDFNGILTMEQMIEVEDEVNELIWLNLPVLETYPSKEELEAMDYRSKKELSGQVRIIEIPGGDRCACCGTHVNQSGEIGILKVTGMVRYKGGVRLSILCGQDALFDYRRKQDCVSEISTMLSKKPDGIVQAVKKLKEEGVEKNARIDQLNKDILERKVAEFSFSESPLLLFEENMSPLYMRQYSTLLFEKCKGEVVLICSLSNGVYQYAMGSGKKDMKELSKRMNKRLEGRGGGSARMVQGTFQATEDDIKKIFKEET